jgi:hypothetical protein
MDTGSEGGAPPLTRDFPSCSKLEPNITSYLVCPLSHPAETGLLISSGDTDRPRCKSHEIAWLVREETKNAPRFPALRSRFPIRQAREWRFSMAGVAWRSLGPHGRDSSALVVDNYSRRYRAVAPVRIASYAAFGFRVTLTCKFHPSDLHLGTRASSSGPLFFRVRELSV